MSSIDIKEDKNEGNGICIFWHGLTLDELPTSQGEIFRPKSSPVYSLYRTWLDNPTLDVIITVHLPQDKCPLLSVIEIVYLTTIISMRRRSRHIQHVNTD